ncbi:hypothetical protein lacNasYZ03_04980 [Lactobacillus nasalidis]|uniref:Uncharacterized protein n=1 Tax=Lactobacillus nasalidis TaxID=2797258 RepID=A0ABQ3W356_9LACO|nr:hypothetical protein lacNasYZ02_11660 [Lactobacillus nasalidis]GHW00811.1 hypothetical protein lacNasYZ03_04980 [Lactobacillus nasalidis]
MANQFGFVYRGALEANEPGKVNVRPVSYELEGIRVAANVYLPADYDESDDKKYAGITVAHPNGGCKEQVAPSAWQNLATLPLPAMPATRGPAAGSRACATIRQTGLKTSAGWSTTCFPCQR